MEQQLDVLLLSAGYGEGHHQAARAIQENLQRIWPGCQITMMDYLEYIPDFIGQATVGLYKAMSKHSPWMYAGVYHLTSQIAGMWGWSHIEYSLGRRHLRHLIQTVYPKVIICTHPLPMAVLSTMRRQNEKVPPVFGVVTDYVLHGEWIQSDLDRYYVPTRRMQQQLSEHGIDSKRIIVSGIPVREAFSETIDTHAARAALNWPDVPTVLFLSSALGTLGGVVEACQELLLSREYFRLVVICGRDTTLAEKLRQLIAKDTFHPIEVLGYVHNIADYMRASDIIVTKAGGITLSEALSLQRTIVIYRPIPGQESGNSRWAAQRGAVVIAKTPESLCEQIETLLANDALRITLSTRAGHLAKPRAARRIASDAFEAAGKINRMTRN
ncbi:MGDG synthase family glycosyltransferase [Alicyclobacillus tolerans]|uniref:Processive 1,2-diacylglycerol beta-glucosyltransferase n=1 Tax=Alicyclobacillus tolerans TaxID=90970 RepID=A0ABT9LTA9_9BACL|nr:glycosyltransferase [Alicyclobacillus tengchongensis]MDP9727487.1 processive 1,2-diacylglycerol beta-glucosyltransferase [Alicyclobacillus tengchongensis]